MGGCDEIFDNRGALKRHRTEAHPELEEFKPVDLEPDDPDRQQDMTVACPVCERKFKHKNTCTVHIKTNHLGWSKRKLFECPDCFRSFDNKKAVEAHREAVHLGIRTLCPLCEKPVTRLDLHVRMVHTELPEWPCPGESRLWSLSVSSFDVFILQTAARNSKGSLISTDTASPSISV